MFEFNIHHRNKNARSGVFHTPHGKLETPELAFVATEAEIKTIPKEILHQLPIKYMIVNTFHIWAHLRQDFGGQVKHILKEIEKAGGIHKYANYKHVAASDSGGFQVFSMGFGKSHQVGKIGGMFPGKNHQNNDENNPLLITEEGVEFEFSKKKILLTPERSLEIQQKIGADIMFTFDECTSPLNSKRYTKIAMERTHRWVKRCMKVRSEKSEVRSKKNKNLQHPTSNIVPQALFAIVQGGYFQDLRKISAQYMTKLDVPGFGIGGSLGTTEDEVRDVLKWTIPYLPEEKPRHLLGIGKVKDLFDGVECGVDLFDCVIPTREARHKVLYTKKGKINVRKMKAVNEVVDKNCLCQMCTNNVTMEQLNHFFTVKDSRAYFYATCHNVQFFSDLMKSIRQSINNNSLPKLKEQYLSYFKSIKKGTPKN